MTGEDVWAGGYSVISVRVGEALQWQGVDLLRARGGSQPAGAQRGSDQGRQAAGRAGSQDKMYTRKI